MLWNRLYLKLKDSFISDNSKKSLEAFKQYLFSNSAETTITMVWGDLVNFAWTKKREYLTIEYSEEGYWTGIIMDDTLNIVWMSNGFNDPGNAIESVVIQYFSKEMED